MNTVANPPFQRTAPILYKKGGVCTENPHGESLISEKGKRICNWGQAELVPKANLDDTGNVKLGGFQPETGIDSTEQHDGEDNGKISYQGPDLQKDEQVSEVPACLQVDPVLRQQSGDWLRTWALKSAGLGSDPHSAVLGKHVISWSIIYLIGISEL